MTEKDRMIAKIAYLYYEKNKTQEEIGNSFKIHRSTVSRLLDQARKEDLISFQLKLPEADSIRLEDFVREYYQLERLEIVDNQVGESIDEIRERVAERAAFVIRQVIQDEMQVGLSWGASLKASIDKIHPKQSKSTSFYPIAGAPSSLNSSYHVNTLVYRMAQIFHGETMYINHQVVQETSFLANKIYRQKEMQELQAKWKHLDLLIMGIGGELNFSESPWRDLLTASDRYELEAKEVVGELCCRFFDNEGRPANTELDQRIIGMALHELLQVPHKLAIAFGKHKVRAILVAMKQKYINTLVTDRQTIEAVLALEKAER
ncbi:sugar-binding transcriptional regulator [Aerococcus sanguinicola]|uniref:sugar-binding transcriptional regulator n=1 Tax=unclassified Aerococcus TaxID=2618060 RepID=UPI0008A65743|nr:MULTISPECIES: sugar-binding transcriptional regulator [unclassified Aerococcus]MDK6234335.1 sugar-binding transcriptional regulator [Aerococcus sp. UMB10185]MDK6856440.1 sugar-binding transcriptional regulator [Aerococcus sp. UMB7533]OFN01202.1 hypothetical protein HMPREF2626_08040 [Aerococcus sp. HMSC062A02]OHO44344.1 hypothetical protein HMPREF2705_07025 [Aerococcus sp. HMSC035B07]